MCPNLLIIWYNNDKAEVVRNTGGFCTIIFDGNGNCGVVGDCAISIEGLSENLCPTSSMANSFIAQSINVECAKYLIKNNVEVPVSSSLNCDGNEDHNEKYFHQYTRMY